jgi:hypothetical protein
MIAKIFVWFDIFSNHCNRFIIAVIKDFWASSETSLISLDISDKSECNRR